MQSLSVRRVWPWLALLALILLVAIAAFVLADTERLRRLAERDLAKETRLPVRIGRLERIGGWLLAPDLAAHDVVIGQAHWVASKADLAHFATVRAHLSLGALLVGRNPLSGIAIEGGRVDFTRNSDGRGNWTDKLPGGRSGSGEILPAAVAIRRLRVTYDDKRRERFGDVEVSAVPFEAVTFRGDGRVRGAPVRVAARIAADGGFRGLVAGRTIDLRIAGTMDRPYSFAALSGRLVSTGHDLRDLDALVEAGLPATQDFTLKADLRHEARSWIVTGLGGRIGRSSVDGRIRVDKQEDRSIVHGSLHAAALDFDDLTSDEGLARGAAKERALGPRLVPDTPIALDHLQTTDGRLDFRIDRLLWPHPSVARAAQGSFRLDHGVLRLEPVRILLSHGVATGSAVVTQKGIVPTRMAIDFRMTGGRVEDFAGDGQITGPLRAHVAIAGSGRTVREVFAAGAGKAAFVADGGSVDHRLAELMGHNVGRAMKAGAGDRVGLRCLVADFRGHGGRLGADPLIVDTAITRADGTGQVDMRDERIALRFAGGSKVPAAFRVTGAATVRGTLKRPDLVPPAEARSAGGIFRIVGRAVSGDKQPAAPDADCAALTRRALQ